MEDQKQSHWAKIIDGSTLHISNAKSGANGYFCPGCNSVMIANKCRKRSSFYRHHPKDVEKHKKCTFSNEEYRRKLAKEILQIIKQIKVRPVYIPIPEEHGGGYAKIRKSQIISADSVLIGRFLYENENGEIDIDHTFDPAKTLLLRTDAILLDHFDNPILFVIFKSKEKITESIKSNIISLAINTVEVTIPENFNAEQIEKIFYDSKYTKWIYNDEQRTTKYNPNSERSGASNGDDVDVEGAIPEFEETYNCTAVAIKNVIRRIRKFMGSAEFQEGERTVGNEIARIGEDTERLEAEYQRRIDDARSSIDDIKGGIGDALRGEAEALGVESARARGEAEERNGGYLKSEIDQEDAAITDLESKLTSLVEEEASWGEWFQSKEKQIERIITRIQERKKRLRTASNESTPEVEQEINDTEREIKRIEKFRDWLSGEEYEFEKEERKVKATFGDSKSKLDKSQQDFENLQRRTKEADTETQRVQEAIRRINFLKPKLSKIKDDLLDRRLNRSK